MPNILICGFGKRANGIKRFIDALMQELDLQDEAITSIITMRAESCDGKKESRPYLCVRGTNNRQIFPIIDKFKEVGLRLDLEWEVIGGFIPAEDMIIKPPPKHFKRSELTCCREGKDSRCEPNKRPPGYCNGCGG